MNAVYKSLLLRYQNYLIEFCQLIEDKEIAKPQQLSILKKIRKYLDNMPDIDADFEIELGITTALSALQSTWMMQLSNDGFSIRSFTLDGLDEVDEWYFHYHDHTREYEGNLFTDGDWDLFLEEVAEVDDADGKEIKISVEYQIA